MRLGWLSDIHLNFLSPAALGSFFYDLAEHDVDAWLVGGDIGEANSLFGYLDAFARLPVHTYFVLGNHDYYRGSIGRIRVAKALVDPGPNLTWLTDAECIELSADTALVGDDGWADGRIGNALTTPIELNDFYLIRELSGLERAELVRHYRPLGMRRRSVCSRSLRRPQTVISRCWS